MWFSMKFVVSINYFHGWFVQNFAKIPKILVIAHDKGLKIKMLLISKPKTSSWNQHKAQKLWLSVEKKILFWCLVKIEKIKKLCGFHIINRLNIVSWKTTKYCFLWVSSCDLRAVFLESRQFSPSYCLPSLIASPLPHQK